MDLISALRKFAYKKPRVYCIEALGGTQFRLTAENWLYQQNWKTSFSPASTDILLICGNPDEQMAQLIANIQHIMPSPAATVLLSENHDLDFLQTDITEGLENLEKALKNAQLHLSQNKEPARTPIEKDENHHDDEHDGHSHHHDESEEEEHEHSSHDSKNHESHDHSQHKDEDEPNHEAHQHGSHNSKKHNHSQHQEEDEDFKHEEHEHNEHQGDEHKDHQHKHEGHQHGSHDSKKANHDHAHQHEDEKHNHDEHQEHKDHEEHKGDEHKDHEHNHDEHEGHDHEGHDHHHDMKPGGLAMAKRAEDRDGLKLDVLHVPLGPILYAWPAGLYLETTMQGDVIQDAKLKKISNQSNGKSWYNEPWDQVLNGEEITVLEVERHRIISHLDSLHRLLMVIGNESAVLKIAQIKHAAMQKTMDVDAVSQLLQNLKNILKGSQLEKLTKGIGRLTIEEAKKFGLTGPALRACGATEDLRSGSEAYGSFEPLVALGEGDARSRWHQWIGEIEISLQLINKSIKTPLETNNGKLEGPRGILGDENKKPSIALIKAICSLIKGQELAVARILVASFDPDINEL